MVPSTVLATTTSDAAGFYFFPTSGVWNVGSNYSVRVGPFPARFHVSTPPSQTFTYLGNAMPLANFVLN